MSTTFACPHCGTPVAVAAGGQPAGVVCPACGRPLHEAAVAAGAPPGAGPARRHAGDRWEQPEPVPVTAPPIPGSVKAAGIIWIVFGSLILLSFVMQVLTQLVFAPPEERGQALGGTFLGGLIAAVFGGQFLVVGVQSLTGTAKGTLGNGIGSILFAVLLGGCASAPLVLIAGTRLGPLGR
jgi:hypothetical protein